MESEDYKQSLGERAKDIIAQGLSLQPNHSGMCKCPLHADKKPSMSWFKDGLMWRCHACGGQIDIYKYYQDYERMSFIEAKNKVADMVGIQIVNRVAKIEKLLPKIEMRELTKEAIDLMAIRHITETTLAEWKVKQSNWCGHEVYVYQYYDDGILKHVSYREIKAKGFKGGCEKDTEAILWGMWHVDKSKPLVITEGQPDAMAVWQSGYKNVVSIPSGAKSLTWIDNCWNWLKGIKEFIVFADNDKPGLEFADNVKDRLDNVKIVFSESAKDANAIMYKFGPEKVVKIITDAINAVPDGLIDVSRMEYKSLIDSQDGGIETGFIEYDRHVEDWKEEELTVINGRNGEGKTTFVSQIIAHCLERNVKVFLYSGEMSNFKIQDWLYKQLAGNNPLYLRTIKAKYRDKTEVRPDVIARIKKWHEGKLFLFDRKVEKYRKDTLKFFELMATASQRYGIKLFVIDNLMSKLEENADALYSDQSNFVQKCKEFAVLNKVHVVLLTHPNKVKGELEDAEVGNLDKLDISGSNNIANKADNIIAIERNWGVNPNCDAIVTSHKDRESGERKVMKFMFSKKTLRFYNDYTNEQIIYGWEGKNEMKGIQEVVDDGNCPF